MKAAFMKKWKMLFLLMAIALSLTACGRNESGSMKAANIFIDGISDFYKLGGEYTKMGMQMQAGYAYGYAAASTSSMRLCVDTLLYMGGEGATLEEVVGGRKDNWDEIASYNYASPNPWLFEGLTWHAKDRNEQAQECYHNAALNPALDIENGDVILYALANMSVGELKKLKSKLTALEDQIYEDYTPEPVNYPRDKYVFSDLYLTALGQKEVKESDGDFTGAIRHFEAALAVNPFDGDNFVTCALASLYLGDMNKTFFYVNEGLLADPAHEGLNQFAKSLNEGRPK